MPPLTPEQQVHGPEIQYAHTDDDVTIAYQKVGSGPALVWLPSLSNITAQWRVPALRATYERLARSLTLVLYDGRGTGSSDRRVAPDGYGLDGQVRDLAAVIDAAGADQVALLGFYHSVPAALAYAVAHPRKVSRIVLFGGAARLRDTMTPVQTQALLSLVDQDWDLFADTAARTWLGWGAAPDTARRQADVFRTAATPAFMAAWLRAAETTDVTDLLPRVSPPVLVLHRQAVGQIPVEVSRRIADGVPHGRLLELPGATPTLFAERPLADVDLVVRYVTSGQIVEPTSEPAALTARQQEVLALLAAGDSNAVIARRLGITEHTVERHVANLYRRIGARGRADATAWAIRHGVA